MTYKRLYPEGGCNDVACDQCGWCGAPSSYEGHVPPNIPDSACSSQPCVHGESRVHFPDLPCPWIGCVEGAPGRWLLALDADRNRVRYSRDTSNYQVKWALDPEPPDEIITLQEGMIRAGYQTPDAKTLEESAKPAALDHGFCVNCRLVFDKMQARLVYVGPETVQACINAAECRQRAWDRRKCDHGNKANDCPRCKEIELEELEGDIVGQLMDIVNNVEAPPEVVVEALAFTLRHYCEENKLFPKCIAPDCEDRETFGHQNEINWECNECHKIANICPGPHT